MEYADFLSEAIIENLAYTPNEQQEPLIRALARFVDPAPRVESAFVLAGYAGTGKTSLTGALVKALEATRRKVVLLAPTGRAAKVFSGNSGGHQAFTIHRKIYKHSPLGMPGAYAAAVPADNPDSNTVYIVDEASMIGNSSSGGDNILEDLITYVFSGDNNRLILMGDTAQLPPVGSEKSPAMNPDVLRQLGLKVSRAVLTAVARQAAHSGILFNATRLRRVMASAASQPDLIPKLRTTGFPDITVVLPEDLPEVISQAYADGLREEADTILITRSNKRACEYNAAIRAQVLYREEELSPGDLLIVARNHYFTQKVKGLDFVANGDIVAVERVLGTETRYGIRFADVRLVTSPDADSDTREPVSFDAKIMLDSLADPAPGVSQEVWDKLYYSIMQDEDRYYGMPMDKRVWALRRDPYWTALHVKYAYAVTCHKAQGGQWDHVFVDLSYIPDDALGLQLYRWFYTAVTRAKKHLYLIAPPEVLLE